MGRLDGKVAMITGAARGMGRSHALTLAREGADIVACDVDATPQSLEYALAARDDLLDTAQAVEAMGRSCVRAIADVRSASQLSSLVATAMERFGHIDILVANAGIVGYAPAHELTEEAWDDIIDVNLKGAWLSAKVVIPQMIARGQGGCIVFISSAAGLRGFPEAGHYAAAKHGLVGLMRCLALELGQFNIRCNTIHPASTRTPQSHNSMHFRRMSGREDATLEDVIGVFESFPVLPIRWIEPEDISNALLWLVSDEARYVTGSTLAVDGGYLLK
jgi:SDR family mycofactocin-dependent oxidoreductase